MTKRFFNTIMPTQSQIDDLKPVILKLLQDNFPEMEITDIYLRGDKDFEGDPILRVYIGYQGDRSGKMNVRATAIRKIIEALSERNIAEFPMTTFLTTEEFREEEKKSDSVKQWGGFYNLG